MVDDIQKEMLKRLENLDNNFNLFLNIFKLIYSDKIEEKKEELFKNKKTEKIYELCDGTRTNKDIAPEVGIDPRNVRNHLNRLTSAGLLYYRLDGQKRYYFKTLE